MMHRLERTFAGRRLVIETGRMAKQAAGSALVQFGDTMVLAAVTVSPKRSTLPFFPLTVEYREKTYAAGKIPGGFIKREGRPRDEEILSARIIDRSIRPLFPEGFQNEVQVFVSVISADQENDADMLGLLATSFALNASKIPFFGPIAGVRVGRVEGKWVLNPTFQALEFSDMDVVVAGTESSIMMVEGGALEVSEEDVLDGLKVAQKGIGELVALQEELLAKGRAEKMAWVKTEVPAEVTKAVTKAAKAKIEAAINQKEKHTRIEAVEAVKDTVKEEMASALAPEHVPFVGAVLGDLEYNALREQVLETGLRVDGRKPTEVRPISIDSSVLPRAHGSALFTRGQTQALVAATLGTANDVQRMDSIDEAKETTKSFMLHYNFPPFSTGEVRPVRGTSRREIGHGNLAERAIQGVLPAFEEFPYTIRIVSDVLESNGSSSMASVCGASLAMMDAGVPLKAPVAGVAMGLVLEGKRYKVITDILGDEDHLGDMDFKVAGTKDGVTTLQMDIKVEGITPEIMQVALEQAKAGRLHILGEMNKVLSSPREKMSEWAPSIITLKIDPEKIRDVIGKGGAVIRQITEETGTTIDIENDGTVKIASVNGTAGREAQARIELITADVEVGRVYEGRVARLMDFGAFVTILPGRDGLVHISQISNERVERVSDSLKEGDVVKVKVLEVDRQGRVRLSMKDVEAR